LLDKPLPLPPGAPTVPLALPTTAPVAVEGLPLAGATLAGVTAAPSVPPISSVVTDVLPALPTAPPAAVPTALPAALPAGVPAVAAPVDSAVAQAPLPDAPLRVPAAGPVLAGTTADPSNAVAIAPSTLTPLPTLPGLPPIGLR
jgi:hypothetical protein